MATTTLTPPLSTSQTASTSSSTNTSTTSTTPTNTATPIECTTSLTTLNLELANHYSVGGLSLVVAAVTFWMYRRGSFTRPMLAGIVIGASLLALVYSISKIVSVNKIKNALASSGALTA